MTTPRRWFQVHLLTAVVMMLALGVILAVELAPRCTIIELHIRDLPRHVETKFRGVPWSFYEEIVYCDQSGAKIEYESWLEWDLRNKVMVPSHDFDAQNAVLDGASVLVVVAAIAYITESILRRSAARARGPAT